MYEIIVWVIFFGMLFLGIIGLSFYDSDKDRLIITGRGKVAFFLLFCVWLLGVFAVIQVTDAIKHKIASDKAIEKIN